MREESPLWRSEQQASPSQKVAINGINTIYTKRKSEWKQILLPLQH